MASGRDTLASIERSLQEVRRESDRLDAEFRRASEELARVGEAELAVLGELARLHVSRGGELLASVGDVDHRVRTVLAARLAAERELARELAAAEEALAESEREHAEQQASVARAAAEAEAGVRDAEARLAGDPEYAKKVALAQQTAAIAVAAESKAADADADRAEKGKPYEADPVFRYLWERGYGTARYRAGFLARLLDGWTARRSRFESMRRNYFALTEIPKRLQRHAEEMRKLSANARSTARAIEERAAAEAGVAARRAALEAAEARLVALDRTFDATQSAVDTLRERRATFLAGEDEHSRECAALLGDALRRVEVAVLRERAQRTASEEDDRLIGELERLERDRRRLKQLAVDYRRQHQAQREQVLRLQDIRRRFREDRYDDERSSFDNGALIATLLERLVAGSVDVGDVWDAITRERRYRDDD